eukprot:SAG31_NODE_6080_length_2180_cov_1.130706_3_plen_89_part_00
MRLRKQCLTRVSCVGCINWQSFGGDYPVGNYVTIKRWAFTDLQGKAYTAASGVAFKGVAVPGKMFWTRGKPYIIPGSNEQKVNIYFND